MTSYRNISSCVDMYTLSMMACMLYAMGVLSTRTKSYHHRNTFRRIGMFTLMLAPLQENGGGGGAFGSLFGLLIAILVIVGLWKVFEKAGQPDWAAIIP